MPDTQRTAQELAALHELAETYAQWCDDQAAEEKSHGNDSSAEHHKCMAGTIRRLAALASQAEPAKWDMRAIGFMSSAGTLHKGCPSFHEPEGWQPVFLGAPAQAEQSEDGRDAELLMRVHKEVHRIYGDEMAPGQDAWSTTSPNACPRDRAQQLQAQLSHWQDIAWGVIEMIDAAIAAKEQQS